jgi:hypothetical protein
MYESLLTIELYRKWTDICIFSNQHIRKKYYICLLIQILLESYERQFTSTVYRR